MLCIVLKTSTGYKRCTHSSKGAEPLADYRSARNNPPSVIYRHRFPFLLGETQTEAYSHSDVI